MSGNKMLKGAAIIGIAGVIVKIMGAFFRIPLTNWLGAGGIAYYSFAYTIYAALVVLATAGFPVAISRLVSENIARNQYRNAHRVFNVSMGMMAAIGLVLFAICYFGAGFIVGTLMKNPGATLAVKAIAPALLFVPLLSAMRGYFQGRQNMNPTAISEIGEQAARVIIGLYLASSFLSTGEERAAAGASFGATVGSVFGLGVMILIYMLNRNVIMYKIQRYDQTAEEVSRIVKQILLIAVPVIIGAEIMPIMNLVDTSIVMRRLQATGWTLDEAKYLYGLISGYCSTLIGFPQIFTQAVAISLVPAIARATALQDREGIIENTALGYRLTMVMALPCAAGILALAKPILFLLYPTKLDEAADAAPTLMLCTLGLIALAISQTSTGVLQAIGKQNLPVMHLAAGTAVKMVTSFILVGIPVLNIKGAALGTIAAYVVSFVLNNISVRKYTGIRFNYIQIYGKPGLASLVMGVVVFAVHLGLDKVIGGNIATVASVMVGVIIYALLFVALRIVTPEELETVSIGRKMNRIIRKIPGLRWE